MKTNKLILFVGLLSMAFWGCNKESHPLTEIDKQMIPYELGDTIRFINESGRLSTLPVVEDETEWRETTVLNKPVSFECRRIYLKSKGDYWIYMYMKAWTTEHDGYRFVDIGGASAFVGDFRIYYDSKGHFRTGEGQYQYVYDSLEIDHKVYYNVCFVRGWQDARRELYYNTEYGILQVKKSGRNIFTLVP